MKAGGRNNPGGVPPLPGPDDAYPVELSAPPIDRFATGNTGVPYVTTLESGRPGPHVAVTAVVHGNELCGVHALLWLFAREVRPERGRLSLAFVNVEAYRRFDPAEPYRTRWVDEDFNRLWQAKTLDGAGDSVELRRARELRPWLDTVDLLLDLHTMQHKTPPLMMAGPLDKSLELAMAVGAPSVIVRDGGHAAGKRMRDYEGFGDPASAKIALLAECGQHWEAAAAPRAIETTVRFLRATAIVPPHFGADALGAYEPAEPSLIEVTGPITVRREGFRFAADYKGLEVIPEAGTVIAHDGDEEVRTPYPDCVLIMPSRRLWPGYTAVRLGRFVR